MRRILLTILGVAVVVASGASGPARPSSPSAAADVRLLMERIRTAHPDPFHATSEAAFQAAADDLAARADGLSPDQFLVELMRFSCLLGERDGHSGIFPRDNEATRDDRFMSFMLTAEVLHGLGLRPGTGPASFTLQRPGTAPQAVTLAPVSASAYLRLMHPLFPSFVYALPKEPKPLYLRRRGEDHYVTTIDRGRVVFVGYNMTLGSTGPEARRLLRLARQKRVRRVVVDVRLNPGGDNHTYAPLLAVLRSKAVNRPGRLVVLISRSTFSAAENFITDLERRTRAVFVGETSGGSPNLYGDATGVDLPAAGVYANIATRYWQKSFASDTRVGIAPKVTVPLS